MTTRRRARYGFARSYLASLFFSLVNSPLSWAFSSSSALSAPSRFSRLRAALSRLRNNRSCARSVFSSAVSSGASFGRRPIFFGANARRIAGVGMLLRRFNFIGAYDTPGTVGTATVSILIRVRRPIFASGVAVVFTTPFLERFARVFTAVVADVFVFVVVFVVVFFVAARRPRVAASLAFSPASANAAASSRKLIVDNDGSDSIRPSAVFTPSLVVVVVVVVSRRALIVAHTSEIGLCSLSLGTSNTRGSTKSVVFAIVFATSPTVTPSRSSTPRSTSRRFACVLRPPRVLVLPRLDARALSVALARRSSETSKASASTSETRATSAEAQRARESSRASVMMCGEAFSVAAWRVLTRGLFLRAARRRRTGERDAADADARGRGRRARGRRTMDARTSREGSRGRDDGGADGIVRWEEDETSRRRSVAMDAVASARARARDATAASARRAGRLERRAKALASRVRALDRGASAEDVRVATRRAEAERAEAGADAARASDAVRALTRERDAVREALKRAEVMEAERLAPVEVSMRDECEMLAEEIEDGGRRAEALSATRDERTRRVGEIERACETARESIKRERDLNLERRSERERARGEKDALSNALLRAEDAASTIETRFETTRRAEKDAEESARVLERELNEVLARNAVLDERVAASSRGLSDLESLAERESLARDAIAAESVRLEIDRRALEKSLTRANQILLRESRSNAQVVHRLRETNALEACARQTIEDVRESKLSLERELATATNDTERVVREQNALKVEVHEKREECKTEITRTDALSHTVSVTLRGEVADLEDEIKCLRREAAARDGVRKHVADRVARANKRHQGVRQNISRLESLLRVRENEIGDAQSSIEDARERQCRFEQLQELMRTQRDAFASVVKKSNAVARATRERTAMLEAKRSDLERETRARGEDLSRARAETDAKKRERDLYQGQCDAVTHVISRARAECEVSETEIRKLQDELRGGKVDLELIIEQSRALVKSRQIVAMELLDRNAELCQLCDRVATSEDVTRQCEEELALRVHECELLRRNVHDVGRSVAVARRRVATIPGRREEISFKRATLYEMQISAEHLSARLEDPNEHARWRLIHGPKGAEGDAIDVDDVNDKLSALGSRIEVAERELDGRNLRCRDIDREVDRVRRIVTENADDALNTASSLNRAKFKLSALERSVLALSSELAMYRALTTALANAKSRNIAEVDALRLSLEESVDRTRAEISLTS